VEEIIAAIVQRKEETGMTWREISKRSGVCCHTIIGWIDKRHAPHLDSLALVLHTLGMRLAIEKIEK
jgi:DNA-binding phage protein